jgi:DNA polymerase V
MLSNPTDSQQNHVYALVDCNNFYVSCERVFDPTVDDEPAVVLSNNDGCVIARSDEVKELGVEIGVPYFEVEDQLEQIDAHVFSSNYPLYGDMSERVMEVLEQFTPSVEVYSIDEAFLDLTEFQNRNLVEYGREMAEHVKQCTGIPISVGIGSTKTLSKIASECVKRDKSDPVCNLVGTSNLDEVLESIAVDDVWGIGRRREETLLEHGIKNARQLRDADERWIRDEFTVMGHRTVQELKGVACFEFEDVPPPKKNIASAKSFSEPVTAKRTIKEAITDFTDRGCEKLREQDSVATGLQVFIRTNRFRGKQYKNSAHVTLDNPTNATHLLVNRATEIVDRIYRDGYKYKKAGVFLTGLRPEKQAQKSLWESEKQE